MSRVLKWIYGLSLSTLLFLLMFFVSLFVLFVVLEYSESARDALELTKIRYYAIKKRFVPDSSGLIFRNRPGEEVSSFVLTDPKPSSSGELHFTKLPVQFNFDELGFRKSSTPGSAQIVVIGDSFMEAGHADANTYAELLGRESGLSNRNLGVSWYGPPQYLSALKSYGLKHKPRYVVLGVFEGNDLRDTGVYQNWLRGADYYFYPHFERSLFSRFTFMTQDIFHLTEKTFFHSIRVPLARARGRYIDMKKRSRVHLQIGDSFLYDHFDYPALPITLPELGDDPSWKALRIVLDEFKELAAKHQFTPLVLLLPTKQTIYGPLSTDKSGDIWLAKKSSEVAARLNFESALTTLTTDLGLPYLSLRPIFDQKASEGLYLYYGGDSHWNAEAREIAARESWSSLRNLP